MALIPRSLIASGGDDNEPLSREVMPEDHSGDHLKAKAALDALHSLRRQLTAELHAATGEVLTLLSCLPDVVRSSVPR